MDTPLLLDLLEAVAAEGRWIATELPVDRDQRARRWRSDYLETPSGELFVAELSDKIIGNAGVLDRDGLVDLGILVAQDHRGRGVGAALLQSCIDWAHQRGAHKITLEVWPDNQGAIRLYERFGFEREGYLRRHYRRSNGEIWDSVVMGLILDPSPPS